VSAPPASFKPFFAATANGVLEKDAKPQRTVARGEKAKREGGGEGGREEGIG